MVDANVVSEFIKQFGAEGGLPLLIEKILDFAGIVLTDVIEAEWESTCGSTELKVWLEENVQRGRIRYVEPDLDDQYRNKLRVDFGLTDSRDLEHVGAANVTVTRYIVTGDSDFYDPKLKTMDADTRVERMEQRTGKVCRFLDRELEIRVGLPGHVEEDIDEFAS